MTRYALQDFFQFSLEDLMGRRKTIFGSEIEEVSQFEAAGASLKGRAL